ncbi:MAG: radical SAM protein, partial [Candidatus Aenigmarchaeota archaeon]|nr:radical SAM protein [Candidatus Aenigmarchaeota archaeon]
AGKVSRATHMFTSRGCPFACRFCSSSHFWERKLRMFSPEYVVGEMNELVNKYRVEEILLFDDLFASDLDRLKKIVNLIKEDKINEKVDFGCLSRVDIMNDERMRLLKEMNVLQIDFGFESGSQRILNYLKRDTTTVEMNRKAVELSHKYGMKVHGFFMIGAPDETKEDMHKTLDFIKSNKIDTVTLCVVTPYPGTEIWEEAKQRGLVSDNMDWNLLDLTPEKGNFVYLNKTMPKEEFLQIYDDFKRQIEVNQYAVSFKMKDVLSPFVMKYAVTHPREAWRYLYNSVLRKKINK